MVKIGVDIGVDTQGAYTVQIAIGALPPVALDPTSVNALMADLATATSLILAQGTPNTEVTSRTIHSAVQAAQALQNQANNANGATREPVLKWHRTAPQSSHYVAETESGHRAEAFKGKTGWVAVLDGETISDVVSKKGYAQRLVADKLSEMV